MQGGYGEVLEPLACAWRLRHGGPPVRERKAREWHAVCSYTVLETGWETGRKWHAGVFKHGVGRRAAGRETEVHTQCAEKKKRMRRRVRPSL